VIRPESAGLLIEVPTKSFRPKELLTVSLLARGFDQSGTHIGVIVRSWAYN
jgi:hypothetical protein